MFSTFGRSKKLIQITHCELYTSEMYNEKNDDVYWASRGPSRIKIIVHFVGLRAKVLEMFVNVDDDRRRAAHCTLFQNFKINKNEKSPIYIVNLHFLRHADRP